MYSKQAIKKMLNIFSHSGNENYHYMPIKISKNAKCRMQNNGSSHTFLLPPIWKIFWQEFLQNKVKHILTILANYPTPMHLPKRNENCVHTKPVHQCL